MKRILLYLFLLLPFPLFSQLGLNVAVKAGLNFANVTNSAGISADNRTGYMIGGYIASKPKKLFGFRSEIMLSRQGYDYRTSTNTGTVNLDYLLLPQLLTLNITKKAQLHAGGQIAFLLNADVDSTGTGSGSLFEYFKRVNVGVVGGGEISPVLGLFFGARINISLNNLNDNPEGTGPDYVPKLDVKNNVIQVYAGWRF